jgi:membrane-associated phospholipid phosphatase
MKSVTRALLSLLMISLVFASCKRDITDESTNEFKKVSEYDFRTVHDWNELYMVLERYADGFRPVGTALSIGYIGLANYEATVTGMPEYKSLASQFNGLEIPKAFTNQEYHWPTVVNAVNNYMFSRFFPKVDQKYFSKINALNDKNEKQFQTEVSQEIFTRSKNHGIAVAAAIWDWYRTDVAGFEIYNDAFRGSDWQTRANQPGAWVPTFPGPGEFLYASGGKCRPFAISEDLLLCKPYTDYIGKYSEQPGKGVYIQALEVLDQQTSEKSYTTKWIGEFWSDDLLDVTFSPPARWLAIADQVFTQEKSNLQTAVVTNAKLGMALADAGIGAWNSKYFYNLMRPETYIQSIMDPSFTTNLNNPVTQETGITPPFPAYPSGHATFAGAGSEILSNIFGSSYTMTDRCHENRGDFLGTPRTFTSFKQMANEIAWSRVLLGVHFRCDGDEALAYGNRIAQKVESLPWKK